MFAAHKRTNNASGYAIFQNTVTVIHFSGACCTCMHCTSEGERTVSTVSLVVVLSVDLARSDHSRPDPDSSLGIG